MKPITLMSFLFLLFPLAYANIIVPIYSTNHLSHQPMGHILFEKYKGGVLITPELIDLPPGIHGFHIHVAPSCDKEGLAAKGHLDPQKSNAHNGPYAKKGHLGDLPVLVVAADGTASLPLFAPRIRLDQLYDHSIMIHAGGDNYSDNPKTLGGGGDRIACGVISRKNNVR